jgi:O-antigen/teichoic acid export membrane protein
MTSVRGATLFALAQRYLSFCLQLVVSVVVARLLSPQETGIFVLAAGVAAIAQMLRDFGVSDYIIAEKDIDDDKRRAAFTVMTGISVAVGVLLLAVSYPLSAAYQEPGVARVLWVLSLTYFLLPLGVVPMAELNKALRFREIFWIQSSSAVASAVVTLGCAWYGQGYMSLAYGMVAGTVASIAIVAIYLPDRVWMRPTRRGLGEVFRFGGILAAGRIVDQVATRRLHRQRGPRVSCGRPAEQEPRVGGQFQ